MFSLSLFSNVLNLFIFLILDTGFLNVIVRYTQKLSEANSRNCKLSGWQSV